MNKLTRILALLTIAILLNSSTASAGLFDWTKTSGDVLTSNSSISLDSIYASLKSFDLTDQKKDISFTDSSYVQETSSPLNLEVSKTKVSKKYIVSITGYSSTPDQTDSSPFITASGTYVRDGVVAANFLPIGTAIKIPDLYGDKIFVVEDRMNRRYQHNVDIWFADRDSALDFGRKTVTIEVI